MGNRCLQAALKYATQYGWAVFPVGRTKRPLTPNGCKDAKKDPGAIKHWWSKWPNANVAIATGSASNLIVIDEDMDGNKGIDGFQSVMEWERVYGELPETVRAITGRGGAHVYYHYDGKDIKNRASILEGVDVRGEGGYVVAPPSVHANGSEYQWEYDPEEIPLAPLDDTVKAFLELDKPSDGEPGESFHIPETIPSGARNDTLFKLACSLQAQGLPDVSIAQTLADVNREKCDEPLDDEELDLILSSALKYRKGEIKVISDFPEKWHEPKLVMKKDNNGNDTDMPLQTIRNAEEAIAFDADLFGRIRWNELAYAPYVYGSVPWRQGKNWREWTNADDSNLRSYIESKYKLKNSEKIMDALTNVSTRYKINPVKSMLEVCADQWDGNKYIENLLPMMLGAEKNEYNTAAIRLFMMGAIMRTYHPGCKFDYMLVLVGPQGQGKSAFFRFLALSDEWYNDNFSTLDTARAVENLRGMWIVELAELQATKRAKDVEMVKAFITSRVDVYRAPYGRRTEQRPRMCVLGATSNPVDFLTDHTGNRRFLPVTCNADKPTFDMFEDELQTRMMFVQAWGEAMHDFHQQNDNVRLVLPKRLQNEALKMQESYLEDDPQIGIIQAWLDTSHNDRVCALMIWREALGNEANPKRSDINQIHDTMKNCITGWRYVGRQRMERYGVQRCYDRESEFIDLDSDDMVFD